MCRTFLVTLQIDFTLGGDHTTFKQESRVDLYLVAKGNVVWSTLPSKTVLQNIRRILCDHLRITRI